MRGVAKEVTLRATQLRMSTDASGRPRLAFEMSLSLNRQDYGVTWNPALEARGFLLGNEITVTLSLQATAS
jgi:polyisoprenoid-binding protein YceI